MCYQKNRQNYIAQVNIINSYIDVLKNVVKNSTAYKNLKIVWDCSNGPISNIIDYITLILPRHEHIILNNKVDGEFPGHSPDTSVIKNFNTIIKAVKNKKCDLGIIFDGDGDRVCFIDNNGQIVSSDYILMILAREILKEYPEGKIIIDVKGSMRVFNLIRQCGGIPIMSETGHTLIKRRMIDNKAVFAGEVSGHLFFADIGFDDGIYAALKIIDILLERDMSFIDLLKTLPVLYITPEIKIEISDKEKFNKISVLKNILLDNGKDFLDIDGIRAIYDKMGWWLLRASNTQNYIVARCEGYTKEDYEYLKSELLFYIKKILPSYQNILL